METRQSNQHKFFSSKGEDSHSFCQEICSNELTKAFKIPVPEKKQHGLSDEKSDDCDQLVDLLNIAINMCLESDRLTREDIIALSLLCEAQVEKIKIIMTQPPLHLKDISHLCKTVLSFESSNYTYRLGYEYSELFHSSQMYELCLLPEHKKSEKLGAWKLYLQASGEDMEYSVISPLAKGGESVHNVKLVGLKAPEPFSLYELYKIKHRILSITASKGHTYTGIPIPKSTHLTNLWLRIHKDFLAATRNDKKLNDDIDPIFFKYITDEYYHMTVTGREVIEKLVHYTQRHIILFNYWSRVPDKEKHIPDTSTHEDWDKVFPVLFKSVINSKEAIEDELFDSSRYRRLFFV